MNAVFEAHDRARAALALPASQPAPVVQARGFSFDGHGINDADKYCIEIDWKRELEKWCATIVKGEDGTYYLGKVDPARKIEFTK